MRFNRCHVCEYGGVDGECYIDDEDDRPSECPEMREEGRDVMDEIKDDILKEAHGW